MFTARAVRAVSDVLARVLLRQTQSGARTPGARHPGDVGRAHAGDQTPVPVRGDAGTRPGHGGRRLRPRPEEATRGLRRRTRGPSPGAAPAAAMAQGHARPDHTEGASVQPLVRQAAAATGGREQSRGGARAVRERGGLHARRSLGGRQLGQLLSDSDADAVRLAVAARVFRVRGCRGRRRRRRRRRHADRLQKRRQSETTGVVGPQFRAERYVWPNVLA